MKNGECWVECVQKAAVGWDFYSRSPAEGSIERVEEEGAGFSFLFFSVG